MMTSSKELIEAVKDFEGLRLDSYRCPSGIWTIGYGHTEGVTPKMSVNKLWAERALKEDLKKVEKQVQPLGITFDHQGQYDAIVDFVFNLGITKLKQSTLLKYIRANASNDAICGEFEKWVYGIVNGKKQKLQGLVKRRAWESKRWRNG